jgi:hypothetical protein
MGVVPPDPNMPDEVGDMDLVRGGPTRLHSSKTCVPPSTRRADDRALTPGLYVRLLSIGYFEGLDAERGMAWRPADSLALPGFLGLSHPAAAGSFDHLAHTSADRSGTHQPWSPGVLQVLAGADLVRGKTIGIDATTPEATPRCGALGGVTRGTRFVPTSSTRHTEA